MPKPDSFDAPSSEGAERTSAESGLAEWFLARSRGYLIEEYPRKIERALAHCSSEDLWWRPNPASNALGNLVLHLAGNVRQWVVHGLGGVADVRQRAAEFEARSGLDVTAVLAELDRATADADRVLRALDPASLQRTRTIQGLAVTGLEALYHVVEHFSMHTGQILYLVKLRTGQPLGFYEIDDSGRVVDTHW